MPNAVAHCPESIAACLATTMSSIRDRSGLLETFGYARTAADKKCRSWPQPRRGECTRRPGDRRQGTRDCVFLRFGDERRPSQLGGNFESLWRENLLPDFTDETVKTVADQVARVEQPGNLVIASIHWEPNWGYEISDEHRSFAHALIDQAHVSIVHGHSSHHPKAIEIYKNQLILYGCGDFLNDYEGIHGYEEFRG